MMGSGTTHLPYRLFGGGASAGCLPRWTCWPWRVMYQPPRASQYQGEGFFAIVQTLKVPCNSHGGLRACLAPVQFPLDRGLFFTVSRYRIRTSYLRCLFP